MAEDFVKKDVFDARMDRMEALLEKTLIEMKAEVGQLRSEVKEEVGQLRSEIQLMNERLERKIAENTLELRGEIRALDARVDALQTWQYWQIAWIGILVAAVALLPAITQYLRRKGEMTVEKARDVLERFVEASAAVKGA